MEDASDILGGQLHANHHGATQPWPDLTAAGLLYYTLMTILFGLAIHFLQPYYVRLRDARYHRSLRRRHGIPDSDRRPFNLAFAAAKRAQLQLDSETSVSSSSNDTTQPAPQSNALQRRVPRQRVSLLREDGSRLPRAQTGLEDALVPSRGSSYVDSRRTSGNTVTASESSYDMSRLSQLNTYKQSQSAQPSLPVHHQGSESTNRMAASAIISKRGLEDIDESEQDSKKTRVEGNEFIDGDEEAEWHNSDVDMDVHEAPPAPMNRGSKRMADADEDEGFESSRGGGRDKRARKVSNGKEVEYRNHVPSLRGTRGRKRDHTEAESSVGGHMAMNVEEYGEQPAQRRRRVASNTKKTSSTHSRKRGREVVSTTSDDDELDSPSNRAARHKRGKHGVPEGESTDEEDGVVSADPKCGGRNIREEWQSSNVRYKVGPNGQRQRQAIIKKVRPRYAMPNDSVHPDRDLEFEVCLETWLTDEQYRIAKERQELVLPEFSQKTIVSKLDSPSDIPGSPSKGKGLLWASAFSKDVLAPRSRTSSQVSPGGTVRVNPLNGTTIRRISTISTIGPVILDSPNLHAARSISKWEKQEREARSLAYLSELGKMEAPVEPVKKQIGTALTAAPTMILESAAASAPVQSKVPPPTSTTATSSIATPAPSTSSSNPFSFAKPAASSTLTVTPAKASTSDLPSLTIPTAPAKAPEAAKPSTIQFPSFTAGSHTTEQSKPAVPSSTLAPPPSNMFSFAKPAEPKSVDMSAQPSAPTVPSSTAPPVNPFAAPLAQPSVPAKSSLSFNFTAPPPPAASKAEAQPTTANDSSLLLRMGGFSAPSQAAAAPVAAITTPAQSFWSNPTTTSTATVAVPTSASSNVSAPANFSFGGISTPTPSSVPAAPPPVNASKPSITFSFAPTTQAAPSANSKPATSSKPAAQPLKFTFNGIGTGSSKPFSVPFGAPPVNQQATLGAATSAAPLFGVTTASTLDTNGTAGPAFGGPSQFGASSTVATGSAFGTGSSTTPNGTPAAKSAFTFGPSTPFGAPSTPSSYSTSINVFGQPPATQNGTPAANSAFTFGAPSTPTTNTTASSAFGNPSTTPAGTPGASSMVFPRSQPSN